MEISPIRKQNQPALIARLNRALLRGRVRESHLILRGSPEFARLSPAMSALCGDLEALASFAPAEAWRLQAVDSELELAPIFAAALSRVHQSSRAQAAGQLDCLRFLLDAGVSPHAWRQVDGEVLGRRESLLAATISGAGYLPLTKLLLERGADCEESDALVAAVRYPTDEPLELLLASGARPLGSSALVAALERDDPSRIQRLLDAGASPSVPDQDGRMPLLVALSEERSPIVVNQLLEAGASADIFNESGISAFRLAHRQGLIAQADLLVARGADPRLARVDSLFGYCSRGMTSTALELLFGAPELFDQACDPNERLLIDAIRLDKQVAVNSMLELGFSISAAPEGQQPLHVAAHYGRQTLIRQLINSGAALRARDLADRTPLAVAVHSCAHAPRGAGDCLGTVRELLEAGAWPESWMLHSADEDLAELLNRYLAD